MRDRDLARVVRRADEELALVNWPRAEPAGAIAIGRKECFVTAMGFEKRALAGLERACEASQEGFDVGLVRYLPKLEENREGEFRKVGNANGLNVTEFVYDRERPAGMGLDLASYAAGFDRVFVDISGMSRLLIVQTLAALVERERSVSFYTQRQKSIRLIG